MIDFTAIRALTFDCYGTLIDWETGILGVLRPMLAAHHVRASDAELLALYAELEAIEEAGAYQPYREVLARVAAGIGARLGAGLGRRECDALAESIGRWPAFADTERALREWFPRYQLVVCSNVDDDLFERTRPNLGSPVHMVVTAERCRSYKPNPEHFRVALEQIGLPPEHVLHIAESRRHDIAPARAMGMRTAWVNRHAGRSGPSASGAGDAAADVTAPDLATLAVMMRSADGYGR